ACLRCQNRMRAMRLMVVFALSLIWTCQAFGQPRLKAFFGEGRALAQQSDWPGFFRGEPRDVVIAGDYAYVGMHEGGPAVFDIHDPAKPSLAGGTWDMARSVRVAHSGTHLYAIDWTFGMDSFDVSQPDRPVRVGYYNTSGRPAGIQVSGHY